MAVDMFLKIDGIKGESLDDKHKGSIEIESFSWGVTQTGTAAAGSGAGAGKAKFNDLTFTKKSDTASPVLAMSCATGRHIKIAELTLAKKGQKVVDYFVIKMEDVLVSSYQTGGSEPDSPRDALSLNFAKVTFNVQGQRPDGSVDPGTGMSWDVKANTDGQLG